MWVASVSDYQKITPNKKERKDKLKKKLERGEVEPQAKTNRNQVLNLSKITKHKRKIRDLPTRGELLDGGQN